MIAFLPSLGDVPHLDHAIFVAVSVIFLLGLGFLLRSSDRRLIYFSWLGLLLGWVLVERAGESARKRLRTQVEGLAPTYANESQEMGHVRITEETPLDDALYLKMIEKQIRWLDLNRTGADIYTFWRHPDGNALIIDSETDYDRNGKYETDREQRTVIGKTWTTKPIRPHSTMECRQGSSSLPVTPC